MRVVITVGGSIIIKDHDYKRFQGYSRVLKSMAEEHQIMVVVGGGRTARDYIKIARDLGASEALCDDIGIEVTRLNARILITPWGMMLTLKYLITLLKPLNFQPPAGSW